MRARTLAALLATTALWPGLAFSQVTLGNLPSFLDTSGQHIQDSGVPAARVVQGPSSTPGSGSIACYNGTSATLLKDCSLINDVAITSTALPPLVLTSNSTSVTAASIRQNVTGNVQRDVNQSVVYLGPASTPVIADANAYSAYVRSDVAGGAGDNGVGFKVMAVCNSTIDCEIFGGNSIITDSLVNSIVTATAGQKLIGWEYDFGVTSPNTNVSGVNFQLQGSLSQPAGANAMACAPNVAGTIHWTYCMVSNNGATVAGGAAIYVGAQALSGNNILSQLVQYGYFNAGGVGKTYSTGVNASQQFYIQTSAGAGLASLTVDGNVLVPQNGQYVMGVDTIIGSAGAGSVTFGSGNTLTSVVLGNGTAPVTVSSTVIKLTKYLVANLPACNAGNDGAAAIVTDALAPAYDTIIVGGGARRKLVTCNAANWVGG